MGTYKRLPRERQKPTDELVTWTQVALHWIELNWRAVLTGIGVVAIVAIIVVLVTNYIGGRDEKARELLYLAEKTAQEGGDAASSFEKVFKEYPRSGAAGVARLKLGDILYSKGEYAKAMDVWQALTRSGSAPIRILGLHNVAAAKLALGDAKGAAETYIKAYSDSKNPLKGRSYFEAGLAYEAAGDLDSARKIFEGLAKEDNSNPDIREKSKEHLIWMAVQKK